jgi:hypothetical protein
MNYLNKDGTLNVLRVSNALKILAKQVDDSLYYCFEDLTEDKRLIAIDTYKNILTLANELEREEDELFKIN